MDITFPNIDWTNGTMELFHFFIQNVVYHVEDEEAKKYQLYIATIGQMKLESGSFIWLLSSGSIESSHGI